MKYLAQQKSIHRNHTKIDLSNGNQMQFKESKRIVNIVIIWSITEYRNYKKQINRRDVMNITDGRTLSPAPNKWRAHLLKKQLDIKSKKSYADMTKSRHKDQFGDYV